MCETDREGNVVFSSEAGKRRRTGREGGRASEERMGRVRRMLGRERGERGRGEEGECEGQIRMEEMMRSP